MGWNKEAGLERGREEIGLWIVDLWIRQEKGGRASYVWLPCPSPLNFRGNCTRFLYLLSLYLQSATVSDQEAKESSEKLCLNDGRRLYSRLSLKTTVPAGKTLTGTFRRIEADGFATHFALTDFGQCSQQHFTQILPTRLLPHNTTQQVDSAQRPGGECGCTSEQRLQQQRQQQQENRYGEALVPGKAAAPEARNACLFWQAEGSRNGPDGRKEQRE